MHFFFVNDKGIKCDFLGIINHPVHIIRPDHKMSPSAFIPFCDFGGNMSAIGKIISQFDVPVCNSFQAKIMNDQICYEFDIYAYFDSNFIAKDLDLGFSFLMDYSEDRQVLFEQKSKGQQYGLTKSIVETDESQHASIYLDTVGMFGKP